MRPAGGRYPGWSTLEWWDAQLEPGDCLLLPLGWYHHVDSVAEDKSKRGVNFGTNIWWTRIDELDGSDLDDASETGCPPLAKPLLLDDCEYSEDAEDGARTGCKVCRAGSE